MKIATVVGARPQFIKAAAVSRRLAQAGVVERLIHTGQHYDPALSQTFFDELGLPAPAHHLGVGSGPHGAQWGRMLEALEAVFVAERPDVVLVYGDTNSTLAGALAAAKLHVPVAHVEAGLRSFNRAMPEELNRVLTDHASRWLLAPTEAACANLRREGIEPAHIHLVGDVMFDVARLYAERAGEVGEVLGRLGLEPGGYALATLHRAENTDDPARLGWLCGALAALSSRCPVVLPLHPRTRAALRRLGLSDALGAVQVIEPVGYLDMLALTRGARLVATDSGGLQKEAFFHEVPCVTLRDETEWVELVEAGWNRLVPPSPTMAAPLLAALDAPRPANAPPLYGDGDAARKIVEVLRAFP